MIGTESFLETIAPLTGLVIETVGGVTSVTGVGVGDGGGDVGDGVGEGEVGEGVGDAGFIVRDRFCEFKVKEAASMLKPLILDVTKLTEVVTLDVVVFGVHTRVAMLKDPVGEFANLFGSSARTIFILPVEFASDADVSFITLVKGDSATEIS